MMVSCIYLSHELLTEFGSLLHLKFLNIFAGLTLRLFFCLFLSYFSKFFIFMVKLRILMSLNPDFNPKIKEKEEQI